MIILEHTLSKREAKKIKSKKNIIQSAIVLFAQKGMRVSDAEKRTDLARSTLYRLYNNEATRIDFDSIEKLCKLLDCTPNDLFIISDDQ